MILVIRPCCNTCQPLSGQHDSQPILLYCLISSLTVWTRANRHSTEQPMRGRFDPVTTKETSKGLVLTSIQTILFNLKNVLDLIFLHFFQVHICVSRYACAWTVHDRARSCRLHARVHLHEPARRAVSPPLHQGDMQGPQPGLEPHLLRYSAFKTGT